MHRIVVDGVTKVYVTPDPDVAAVSTFREAIVRSFRSIMARRRPEVRNFQAIVDLSVKFAGGEIVGLSGPNGSGKSTLLKLVAQITYPTAGSIYRNGSVASLLEVGGGFHPELTGRENIYLSAAILGKSPYAVRPVFDDIVEFAGVRDFLDVPVKRFSSGMFVRLAIAVACFLGHDILLLDEVLGVADKQFREKTLLKLRELSSRGVTILMVSHDEKILRSICSRLLRMDKGRIVDDEVLGSPN